jgi:predicted metal-binding protein
MRGLRPTTTKNAPGNTRTSIPIKVATREKLKTMGDMTSTFDEVINRLIEFYEAGGAPGSSSTSAVKLSTQGTGEDIQAGV